MGGCPGILRDPGPGPANPRDWDRDRDSKPRDSRDRDKNLRDSPATEIPRDNESRHFRHRPVPCPSWDNDHIICLQKQSSSGLGKRLGFSRPGRPGPSFRVENLKIRVVQFLVIQKAFHSLCKNVYEKRFILCELVLCLIPWLRGWKFLFHLFFTVLRIGLSDYFFKVRKISRSEIGNKIRSHKFILVLSKLTYHMFNFFGKTLNQTWLNLSGAQSNHVVQDWNKNFHPRSQHSFSTLVAKGIIFFLISVFSVFLRVRAGLRAEFQIRAGFRVKN